MKSLLISAAMAGVIVSGSCAFAADQTQPATQSGQYSSDAGSKDKSMEQCMARQKATNSGLTTAQMQTTCQNEAKTRKNGNDLATGPQAGDKQSQKQ